MRFAIIRHRLDWRWKRFPMTALFVLLGFSHSLCGCIMFNAMGSLTDRDIQQMREKTDGLVDEVRVGATYMLKTDLFLLRLEIGGEESLALGIPTGHEIEAKEFAAPESIAQYHADRTRWPAVVQVIPEGTRVRVSQINGERQLGSGYGYGVLLVDGLSALGSVVLDDALHCVICPEGEALIVIADPWILGATDTTAT